MTTAVTSSSTASLTEFTSLQAAKENKKNVAIPQTADSTTVAVVRATSSKEPNENAFKALSDQIALKNAEETVNKSLEAYFNEKIAFDIDEKTKKTVIKVIDSKTDEVVKQFPPQEFLDMVYALNKAAQLILKDIPKYV